MSFSVNTNSNALAALQTLNMTQRSLSATQAHINTGYKIGGAKDDASTFAIAQGMRGDIAGLRAVGDSLSLGQATVNVALNAAQSISDKLISLKDKVTQAQSANVDKVAIQKDVAALKKEIDDTAAAAQFNGVNLLNTGGTGLQVISSLNRTGASTVSVAQLTVGQQDLTTTGANLSISTLDVTATAKTQATFTLGATPAIKVGDTFDLQDGNGNHFVFEFFDSVAGAAALATKPDATHTVIGVGFAATGGTPDNTQTALSKAFTAMQQQGFSVQVKNTGDFVVGGNGLQAATYTPSAAGSTISAAATLGTDQVGMVENAITSVKGVLATLGAFTNQLQSQGDFVKSLSDTLTSGVSTLVDADLAAESASLQALQTKQQLGIQALSIANQQSGAVLSLFR
jgi:flagellin